MGLFIESRAQESVNSSTFGEIRARHIGSATMSGRISALDGLERDPRVLYVGSASGGVWKTLNGGVSFKPVFDKHIQSIGSILIDQAHPDTVWVGTGESWVRNSVSVGDGIYKTTDGGDNWTHMGLKESERISKLVMSSANPEVVFAGAMGTLWAPNQERGVFKTTDGGKTWEKVLYVDENTGCSDLAIHPENPDILYAAMWDHRRLPYTFRSGGPGSGLYKTTDGGKTWNKLLNGFPSGDYGRIAVAIAPLKPEVVYALVEAKKDGGLYRSDDAGLNWKLCNKTEPMTERPFYFSLLVPDKKDTLRLYKPSFNLHVSDDGGMKFRTAYIGGGNVHPDHHALWVSKTDNHLMYLGTDGGVYKSIDQGKTWAMIRNIPVSQFYRVSVDMEIPYNVYGGLQDNGSWFAPSRNPGGIQNSNWDNIGYGDGFYVFADKLDPNILYWQWQGGNYVRFYKKTGESKEIRPYGDEKTGKLRFNWNSAISFSPVDNTMYVGSQYLFRSNDRGDTWEKISPDLTTNDPAKQKQHESGGITVDNSTAENYCTIYTIAESPLNKDIIWVGTDDGNLQLTTDGGKTWSNLTANLPGLPGNTWCSNVEAGKYDKSTVYVTFDGHRHGDMKPYVYKSEDMGKTFTSLTTSGIEGYCFDIVQDPVNPSLLFLGTEMGLFISIDDGKVWSRLEGNFPRVPVHEMVFHPREHDLVIATHGRGIFILDDLTPLRALRTEMLNEEVVFLPSRPYLISSIGGTQSYSGDDEFTGRNPEDAVYISYYMSKRHIFGDMFVEIYGPDGKKLNSLPAGTRKGINRVMWTPREKAPKVPVSKNLVGGAIFGPTYPPGDYTVKVVKDSKTWEGKLSIQFDPNLPHSQADRDLQLKTVRRAYTMLEDLAYLDARITSVSAKELEYADSKELKPSLVKSLREHSESLEKLHKRLVATETGGITGEEQLRERIASIYSAVMGFYGRPTNSQLDRLDVLDREMAECRKEAEILLGDELISINKQLVKTGKEEIKPVSYEVFMGGK
jgi:photosystem II stability/assembly factor-like uncharacterized protein